MPYYAQRTRRQSNYKGTSRPSYGRSPSRKRGPAKSYIHPSRFVQAATPRDEVTYESTHTFADFEAQELIKINIAARGFVNPTPIQDRAIPAGLQGQDVVGIADTGTGKTVAFGIPVLNKLMSDGKAFALILAPTRELAQQIEEELRMIGKDSGILGALLIGGSSMSVQLRDLRANPQIVIGTPGRVKDHIDRGTLNISQFNMIVLDEVDRMLDMGFINDMREILQQLEPNRQSLFFSATMDGEVRKLIEGFTNDPVNISVKTGNTSQNVEQDIVPYQTNEERMIQLHNLLISEEVSKVLIFDETQRSVERLSGELLSRGFKADAIHGGKSQGQRQRALDKFKKSHINVLVATDVAARGIDVSDITHVINYSQPQAYEDYVHRIGRAGRAGKTGFAYTFVKA